MKDKNTIRTKGYVRSLLKKAGHSLIATIRLTADTKDDDFTEDALPAVLDYLDRLRADVNDIVERKTYLSGTMKKTELGAFFEES